MHEVFKRILLGMYKIIKLEKKKKKLFKQYNFVAHNFV